MDRRPAWCLIISTPLRSPQTSSCSIAAARKVSAAQSRTVFASRRKYAASLPVVVVLPVPLTPTSMMTNGGSTLATGRCCSSRMCFSWSFKSCFSSAPSRIPVRRARSRKAVMISVVVATPMSEESSTISRSSSAASSTSRVSAMTPSIFSPRLSRVLVTACFMRSKMDFFSGSFRLPKRV